MKTLKTFLGFARPYYLQLAITIFSMVALVAVQLVTPWLIRDLIAIVSNPTPATNTYEVVTQLAIAALVIFMARAGLEFLRSYMAHIAGYSVVADVRHAIYRHLQRLSLRYYENKQTGQLMSRMVNDADLLEKLIAHAVPDVLVNVLMLVGVSTMLFLMSPSLMVLTLLPIPLVLIAMRGYATYVQPAFRERQEELGNLNAILQDNLSGIREIKTFTREEVEAQRIGTYVNNYKDAMLRALKIMAAFHPLINLATGSGLIVVIYFGGRMVLGGTLAIQDLVAFFLYLEMFYAPVQHLGEAWELLQESIAGAERVSEVLEESPDVTNHPDAIPYPGRAQGALTFENVNFAYTDDVPVLQDINLTVPAQSVIALVGATGVGKTTLASLIPRFYDVNNGRILLDGHDIRHLTLQSLREQISIVLQDVFLFHGTIRDNIMFGRPKANEAEMREAAKIANATEFIEKLPQGFDTIIGERGVKLSGGQKQRLAIARAVLKNAPILILDEATSAVDTQTEKLIQQALERLMQGRTVLIIAHRLSTIRNADQIVVLRDHGIAERGTHSDLLSVNGVYRHLSAVQEG